MLSKPEIKHHPVLETIVNILCKKTQNYNPTFFRVLVIYHLTKLASMMRVNILTKDRGKIPINLYAVNLANSGQGKGHSTNIIEDELIQNFRTTFFESTYPIICEKALTQLASDRANVQNKDLEEVYSQVTREFESLGALPFAFDSGTTAAVKQMRHKLLMSTIGAMNLEIDEIGSNLLGNADVLTTFLELFDVGKVKQKLVKNTRDNVRNEEIEGKTPTNLLLFGTPSKLLNGSKTEEEFYSFLETGYARRCFFGYTKHKTAEQLTAEEIYDILVDPDLEKDIKSLSITLGKLAKSTNFNRNLLLDRDVSLILINYRLLCEQRAEEFGEYEEIRRAEMAHRYFKVTKLAGTYAFIDDSACVTPNHVYAAICMAEESGDSFTELLKREKNYTKLAKYISSIKREVTHVDLTEDLPFYRGAAHQKNDLMQLAIAWGYKNHIIIKRTINNGIEFIQGETLEKTDLNKIVLAYSDHYTENYTDATPPFKQLYKLTQAPGKHWVNHHLENGYRKEENVKEGFNIVVLDVDKDTPIKTVKALMKPFTYLLHTTKRHTAAENRFRLILPINYRISLNSKDFQEFMNNIYTWLPFTVDTATRQRARKWASCETGTYTYNHTDKLLDALLFIPKTSKNDECKKRIMSNPSLTNLERWFMQNTNLGNRNNQLLKYALVLVDTQHTYTDIEAKVIELNNKLEGKLTLRELNSTILTTVQKKLKEVTE